MDKITFASEINAALAQALDAQVVLVSTADLPDPRKTAEKVDAICVNSEVLHHRAPQAFYLCEPKVFQTAQAAIPVTLDPSLRLDKQIAEFSIQLQRYNRFIEQMNYLSLVWCHSAIFSAYRVV